MKTLILPLATLAALGAWSFLNAQKIANLRDAAKHLNEAPHTSQQDGPAKPGSFASSGQKIDLQKIGTYLKKVSQGETLDRGDRAWLWTEQKIKLMSQDELVTALDELEFSDFPEHSLTKIRSELLAALRYKSPADYLKRIGITEGQPSNASRNAFLRLMKEDRSAAIDWFDAHLKEHPLKENEAHSHLSTRGFFEKTIAEALFPNEIEALDKRFENLHPEQISYVLRSLIQSSEEKVPQSFFTLARTHLSTQDASATIGEAILHLSRDKALSEVSALIQAHALTAVEKKAALKLIARSFPWSGKQDFTEFETLLPFIQKEGGNSVDELYAIGIANFYRNALKGTDDLTEIYQYVDALGKSKNSATLLPTFLKQTISRVCHCCSLESRLSRVKDDDLKKHLILTHQNNLNSNK